MTTLQVEGRNVNADTIVAKGQHHVETLADGEVVLMHIENGRFFTLSGTGRRVWELIGEPIAVGALVDRLTGEFSVDRETCLRDVLALCERLDEGQLLDVSG